MNDLSKIFDVVVRIDSALQKRKNIDAKKAQIRKEKESVCGGCMYWMTKECEREQKTKKLQSMNSIGCKDFAMTKRHSQWIQELEQELKIMEG